MHVTRVIYFFASAELLVAYPFIHPSIHPLGPCSVQSVGAAFAVSLAIGHNPGWVATPTQYTSMLALILLTTEGWQSELTPPGINSTAVCYLNSGSKDPKPTTLTIKPTPGILYPRGLLKYPWCSWLSLCCEMHDPPEETDRNSLFYSEIIRITTI